MKYVAKDMGDAAEASSGGGNQWVETTRLFLMASLLIVGLYLVTVWITDYFVSGISIETEKQWFGQLEMLTAPPSSTSDVENEISKANRLLSQLVQQPDVPALDYRLIVIDEEALNAFAFPGGTIGLTHGLLKQVTDDPALALVIGHELGHFKYRHHLKGVANAFGLSVIFTVVFGGDDNLAVTQNLITLLDARHSQQQELDADAFGAKLVLDTFGELPDVDNLFQQLEKERASSASFLSTHPASSARIAKLKALQQTFKEHLGDAM